MAKRKGGGNEMDMVRKFLSDARRKAWAKVKKADRQKAAAHASRAYWDSLSPEERSAEMRRRAAKRKKRPPRRS